MRQRAMNGTTTMLLLAVTLGGCSFFDSSPPRLFTLETLPPTAGDAASGVAPELPLGIDSLTLPPTLDRREVVVVRPGEPLEVRAGELWAAPLERLVLHTLSFDLAARLPEGAVVLPGQRRPPATLPLTVAIESLAIESLEVAGGSDATLVLDVHWTAADLTTRERIAVPVASLDSADLAAATSLALAELADRIVAAVAR